MSWPLSGFANDRSRADFSRCSYAIILTLTLTLIELPALVTNLIDHFRGTIMACAS
jgi:hypothetical protein